MTGSVIVFFTIPKGFFFLHFLEKHWLSLAWGAPAVYCGQPAFQALHEMSLASALTIAK